MDKELNQQYLPESCFICNFMYTCKDETEIKKYIFVVIYFEIERVCTIQTV
jgi:hypothetical protein